LLIVRQVCIALAALCSEITGKVVITGAEPVKNWKAYKGGVWAARIPNGLFSGYNPYTSLLTCRYRQAGVGLLLFPPFPGFFILLLQVCVINCTFLI